MAIYRSRPHVQISAAPDRTATGVLVQTMQLLSKQTVAATTPPGNQTAKTVIAKILPTIVGAVIFIAALVVAVGMLFGTASPTYTPAAGIGAFALFYIVAQASERVVEFLMPFIGMIPGVDKPRRAARRDVMALAANAANAGNTARAEEMAAKNPRVTADDAKAMAQNADKMAEGAANAQGTVDQAVANRRIVSFAVTAALGMLLCSYLEADFLTAVGVKFHNDPWWAQAVQVGVTGLVVGGGSVGLHDLIGNITKSSKAKDDPAERGGTK